MVTTPADAPVTTPPATVATDGLLLVHAPPGVASLNVIDEPTHTVPGPDIGPSGPLTVIGEVTVHEPTVYVIVATPADTPLTLPVDDTTATPVLLLVHTPPPVASVNAIDELTHTAVGPTMAVSVPLTVTNTPTEQPP